MAVLTDSILDTVKHMLGIEPEQTHFDADIIHGINSAFFVLNQLGIGPDEPYEINGNTETWTSFDADNSKFNAVKEFIYLKTKMVFDPPLSGTVIGEYNKQIDELTWRLTAHHDIEAGRTDEETSE